MALDVSGSSSLFWKTGINNAGLLTGSAQAKGILAGLSKSITRMDVFGGLAIGSALVFAKISKQAYNFSKEFETAMKEVQTISESVQNNFKGISEEVVNMSKTVPDSAQKLTKALYQIVSAGYDGAKAMDILKTSAELATASVTDTFTAADVLTYVLNAYGESAGTAATISDKLFTIVKLGKVKMEELGPTLSMVTGLAAEAGMSFNDLGAFYAEAVKKIQPHIVSTGIRGFVTALLRASKEGAAAAEAAKEMGIEFDIATLKSKGLEYMLKQMSDATEGQKQKLMELFPNVRGLIGLLAILTNEGMNFKETSDAIVSSLGATDKAFATMIDSTENQLAILKNNLMAKLKPLGDSLLSTMNDIAKGINQAMSGTDDVLSNLARTYSGLADTLRRKQGIIDDFIKTIEDLREKTELTEEETTQLHAAEKALATYFPTLGGAAEDAAGQIDILTVAKEATKKLSLEIMELEVERADIEVRQADLALKRYDRDKDVANKAVENIKKQIEIRKKMIQLEQGGFKGAYQTDEQLNKIIEKDIEYLDLKNDLVLATEAEILKEDELKLTLEEKTSIYNAQKEAYKRLMEAGGEIPDIVPDKKKGPDKTTTTTVIIDTEAVEAQLKHMASQYKLYLNDLTQHDKEWIKEHNEQLVIDAENYGQYLSDMREKYKDNAELLKIIEADIYEYNKAVTEKRKQIEDELFRYINEDRERDLKAEKDNFEAIIKEYEEGSAEYISVTEQYNQKILDINNKYNEEIAEAVDKVIAENKAKAEANKAIIESYLESYQTTQEKIAAIHKKTAELMKLTDNKDEQDKLKSIETQLIAEIKASETIKEVNEKLAEFGEDLNNEELENKIKTLEAMKLEYEYYGDIVISLNKEIAASQEEIWENVRDEINQTVDTMRALADTVGNLDTELEEAINDMTDLVDGVGDITIGFSTGNITGIISGIAAVINSIINIFVSHKSDVPELREELQSITLELQKQQTILSQSSGTAQTEAIQNRIDLLKEQIDTYNDMITAEEAAYGQFLWWTWDETDQEKIEEWLSSIENANAEIVYLWQQYQEILTGTTAETIADSIAEGFREGLNSAEVFADTFNDMMRNAIIDAFKRTIITKYIEDWYDQFALLSGGGLTTEEIENLTGSYQDMINAAEDQWDAMAAILEAAGISLENIQGGLDGTGVTGLTGAIAGITEETAGLLAGQFQAIRINTVDILNNMENIIIINSQIADNTKYNKYLESIYNKMNEGSTTSIRSIGG